MSPILDGLVWSVGLIVAARQWRAQTMLLVTFHRIEQFTCFLAAHLAGQVLVVGGPSGGVRRLVWSAALRIPLTGAMISRRVRLALRLSLRLIVAIGS
jgi:hypothetical protein